jgi:hypothetical protein
MRYGQVNLDYHFSTKKHSVDQKSVIDVVSIIITKFSEDPFVPVTLNPVLITLNHVNVCSNLPAEITPLQSREKVLKYNTLGSTIKDRCRV